jgi:hypothetical protein
VVELGFVEVEFMISSLRGTPPMKMDRCQNKGVAGRASCNYLKRKGMDGGNRVRLAGLKLSGKVPNQVGSDPKSLPNLALVGGEG